MSAQTEEGVRAQQVPALSLHDLSKTFGGQVALNRVDLTVTQGEVHALVGQNGSGKSTLIKVLAGYHRPDPGATATVHGVPLELGSAADASSTGSATTPATDSASSVLIESSTTLSDFSSAPVDGSHFQVPAGYQQVTTPGPRATS